MGESPQGQAASAVQQATGGSGTQTKPRICKACGGERGEGATCMSCGSK